MKRRWKIAVAAAALMAIVAAVAVVTGDPEPAYKGRKLSAWISDYHDACFANGLHRRESLNEANSSPSAQALREMCPTVLPTLVRWISYEKSRSIARLEVIIEPIADKIGARERFNLLMQRGADRRGAALDAFQAIGTNASPIIPQLSKIVMDPNYRTAANFALVAISSTGRDGTQAIISLVHNQNNPIRSATLRTITYCADDPPGIVMEEINQQLKSFDVDMRIAATNALEAVRQNEAIRRATQFE